MRVRAACSCWSIAALVGVLGCGDRSTEQRSSVESARALAPSPAQPTTGRVIARRYISSPGEGPAIRWNRPPRHCLDALRKQLSDAEAVDVEERVLAMVRGRGRPKDDAVYWKYWASDMLKYWASYVILFERVGSDDGDKIVVSGFTRDDFEIEDQLASQMDMGPLPPLTAAQLREMVVFDGGCTVWRALYDVKKHAFERFECNGAG